MKRIIWNVRRIPGFDFACIGLIELREKHVWREVIKILYFKKEIFKYHLYMNGIFINKYDDIDEVQYEAQRLV